MMYDKDLLISKNYRYIIWSDKIFKNILYNIIKIQKTWKFHQKILLIKKIGNEDLLQLTYIGHRTKNILSNHADPHKKNYLATEKNILKHIILINLTKRLFSLFF